MLFSHGHKFHGNVCALCGCDERSDNARVHCVGTAPVGNEEESPITMPGLDPFSMAVTSAVDAANESFAPTVSVEPVDAFQGGESGGGGAGASFDTPSVDVAASSDTSTSFYSGGSSGGDSF